MKLPEPTPRLRFREMREEDAAFVLDMFSDEQAQRFHADISSLEIAGRWTAFMMKRQREQGHSLWMLGSDVDLDATVCV